MNNKILICAFGLMLFFPPIEIMCQTASQIESIYYQMISNNYALAMRDVPNNSPDGREPMKNLYYLRPKNMTAFFIKYFNFTGIPLDLSSAERKTLDLQSDESMRLAYLSLLGSGVNVKDLYNAIIENRQKVAFDAPLIWKLGRRCSGAFFDKYIEQQSKKKEYSNFQKILERYLSICSHFSLAFPKAEQKTDSVSPIEMPSEFMTKQGRKYRDIEKILIAKFEADKFSHSVSIEKTISAMGHIRSITAVPLLAENLTICPQVSTNAPGGYVFPAAEALIEIGPAIGYCFGQLEGTKPLSVEESLWLRISHELYPEGLEYDLMRRAETNDTRAARLLGSLQWRRLDSNYELIDRPTEIKNEVDK